MNLPTGTVTFLFTDIEGSTKLAQQNRTAWEALRARHHAILREAVEANDGYVFQIVGDAFCVAFSTAERAVRAAVRAQIDLQAEDWGEGLCIKVRMGMHTGKAELQEGGDYLGYMTMSRVQRLMSAAHGGQVLLSLAAQNQVSEDLLQGVTLRDMGEHRLKSIAQPEHIYQLVIPEVAAEFPPLQTLTSSKNPPRAGLVVKLMGKFEIKVDDQPIRLPSRIAQSLFAYLILNGGRPHRREKLAGMFWPDETEEKARAHLRHELWRIRKALAAKSNADYLSADDISILFDTSTSYWLDVDVLKNASQSSSSDELLSALSLSLGELLPGFYEDWIAAEREHLQAIYEQNMTRLLSLLEGEKRWHEILEWAELWISLGQGPEAAYRALMIAYDALGDRAKVTLAYQRCVEALRELDLEPSEQTRALAFKRTSNLNIPVPLTSFIGREAELEEVAKLISKSRLVTLTGSGGVGKTRLSIQVVADVLELFPDGVWFLDLAPLSDPTLVPNTLADVLDLSLRGGSDLSFTDLIMGYLRSRRALIIFDNCEHLIEACAQLVNSLLTSCERLSILATSRETLRVPGEMPYRVPSLELPRWDIERAIDALARTESVRLFAERAAVVSPGFALSPRNALAVAQICKRLDGIPLAIELAAARVNMLAAEQILKRLDDRFNLLTSGLRTALPRHQTLWATIEWSYNLLSEKERLLFQRLAVFVGGWTLEAAEAVCSGRDIESNAVLDLLSQLVHKSLVLVVTGSYGPRYRRLETIRQFACEKLYASEEGKKLRKQHCAYFVDLAEQADQASYRPERHKWKARLELDNDNFRAALAWCVSEEDTEAALRLFGAWARVGELNFSEECAWFDKIRFLPNMTAYPRSYASLLNHMGGSNWLRGNDREAKSLVEESQAMWRKLGAEGELGLAFASAILGEVALSSQEELESAQSLFEQSFALYQKHGDKWGMARTIFGLGHKYLSEGRYVEAEEQFMKSLIIWKELGDNFAVGGALNELGMSVQLQGDYERAGESFEQALKIERELRSGLLRITLFTSTWVLLHAGDHQNAKIRLQESLELYRQDGDKYGLISCLAGFASVLAISHKLEEAGHLFGAFESLLKSSGTRSLDPSDQKEIDHYVAFVRGQLDEATFAKAWAEGSEMTLEQAITFALVETSG